MYFSCEIYALFRPSIRFSSDEAVACRLATNEIQFFDAVDFSKGVTNRLRVPGVTAIELAKAPGSHVAAFVPESKVCTHTFSFLFVEIVKVHPSFMQCFSIWGFRLLAYHSFSSR